ncbi:MAG: RpiB/LacA/LacB family sugar-phosphate isomerase [Eggerthella lenta]
MAGRQQDRRDPRRQRHQPAVRRPAQSTTANVVAVSGRFVDESVNREILDAFVSTSFGGGRHAGRVEKIAALENE